MPRVPNYSIEEYSYIHMSEDSHVKFGQWLDSINWQPLLDTTSPEEAVKILHSNYAAGIDQSYELKHRKKKSSEPEWMTDWIRENISSRRKIFKNDQGRSDRWGLLKKKTATEVKKRKRGHDKFVLAKFEAESNPGKFFHHLNCLMGKNNGPRWTPMSMYPESDP